MRYEPRNEATCDNWYRRYIRYKCNNRPAVVDAYVNKKVGLRRPVFPTRKD
jgi:hypothetical protein